MFSEVRDTLISDLYRISLVLMTEEGTLDLCSIHLQLSERSSSKSICTYHANSPAFLHVMISELGASSCFSRSLQSDKHHYIRFASDKLCWLFVRGKHCGELIDHCFLNHLS